jgi:hypothetical protein
MINVQMDVTCGHCGKQHLPCAMFIAESRTHSVPIFICAQCLSDAVGAVVAAQVERYRNGPK